MQDFACRDSPVGLSAGITVSIYLFKCIFVVWDEIKYYKYETKVLYISAGVY